jgi:hypothetical protein
MARVIVVISKKSKQIAICTVNYLRKGASDKYTVEKISKLSVSIRKSKQDNSLLDSKSETRKILN